MSPSSLNRTPTTGEDLLDAQDRRKNIRNLLVGGLAVVLVLAGAYGVVRAGGEAQTAAMDAQAATEQRDSAAGQVVSLADQILAACQSGELNGAICPNAARAKVDPVPGPEVPAAPSTDEIAEAVAGYLADHPPPAGPGPSREQITAAVVAELAANPAEPGRAPTEDEIAGAVARFLESNPPPPGEPGTPGRAPTTGEIAAAVAAYLAENPPPRGPQGDPGQPGTPGQPGGQGSQGVGVTDVSEPSRTADGGCVMTFTLTDPASGDSRAEQVAVPDAFCGTPPPSAEPTS